MLSWLVNTQYRQAECALPILMYHRILEQPDPLQPQVPDARQLAMQLKALGDHFTVLPLHEAAIRLRDGTLPRAAACITFDDGYRDNHDIAWPMLRRAGMPASIFVATGFLDRGRMFNDTVIEAVRRLPTGRHELSAFGIGPFELSDLASRRVLIRKLTHALKYLSTARRDTLCDQLIHMADGALPDTVMMTREQVRSLARQGVDIGGHTVNHPILASLDPEDAAHEIITNRDELTTITDQRPCTFAYPNGKPDQDYTRHHAALVASAGYEVAVSTAVGVATSQSDRHQLPRFVVNEPDAIRTVARMWRMGRFRGAACAT
ncbi:polysaccharide deacetylase family protein [Sphaerotilus hippei]|uniref:polysaccharide deacetylase family protein n=1 Tax=Sphaerotilus hippei TaxID=744406 RepID=UPI0014753D0F|nr:polysaccharide deacetylase family protein [Sphaerotilus hippei]